MWEPFQNNANQGGAREQIELQPIRDRVPSIHLKHYLNFSIEESFFLMKCMIHDFIIYGKEYLVNTNISFRF